MNRISAVPAQRSFRRADGCPPGAGEQLGAHGRALLAAVFLVPREAPSFAQRDSIYGKRRYSLYSRFMIKSATVPSFLPF